jgi:LysM repeat protein
MVEGILTASPGNNQPEDDRKTVGKRFTFAYLLGVRKEHVYRRRRIGALFVAAVFAFALYAGGGAGAEPPAVLYTVTPGDTLWSVATEHYPPSEDPRVAVEAIREANGIEGASIYPGMRLELPATG